MNTPWFWHKERRQHVNVWYAHFARDKSRCNEMSCNCCARDKGEKEVEEGEKKVERSLWNENENEEMIKGRECNKRGETILLKRFLTIEIGWAILFFFFFMPKYILKFSINSLLSCEFFPRISLSLFLSFNFTTNIRRVDSNIDYLFYLFPRNSLHLILFNKIAKIFVSFIVTYLTELEFYSFHIRATPIIACIVFDKTTTNILPCFLFAIQMETME